MWFCLYKIDACYLPQLISNCRRSPSALARWDCNDLACCVTYPIRFQKTPSLVLSVSTRVVAILGTLISATGASADGGRIFTHVILIRELPKYLNMQSSKLVKSEPVTTSLGDSADFLRLNNTLKFQKLTKNPGFGVGWIFSLLPTSPKMLPQPPGHSNSTCFLSFSSSYAFYRTLF